MAISLGILTQHFQTNPDIMSRLISAGKMGWKGAPAPSFLASQLLNQVPGRMGFASNSQLEVLGKKMKVPKARLHLSLRFGRFGAVLDQQGASFDHKAWILSAKPISYRILCFWWNSNNSQHGANGALSEKGYPKIPWSFSPLESLEWLFWGYPQFHTNQHFCLGTALLVSHGQVVKKKKRKSSKKSTESRPRNVSGPSCRLAVQGAVQGMTCKNSEQMTSWGVWNWGIPPK